jgi:acetoin utilization deacetylase AcuC-like enzyme
VATGLVFHEIYMWHNTGNFAGPIPFGYPVQPYEHAENPETKRRFRNLLEASRLLKQLTPIEARPATDTEVLRVHTRGHLEKIRSLKDQIGVDAGIFTPMGRGSFDIALLSAGGVVAAADAVLDGVVKNAYALVRPPGHHAMPDLAMGFCMFGNAAIAGRHLLDVRKLERIAFVDWDVHHGNGTQAAFWEEPRALTISIHQDNCFPPNSGHLSENGAGKGEGFNINIPLPPGSGVGAYEAAFDRVILPALEIYKPDMIIVPSGFDAGAHDPLGRQMLTSEGYRSLTKKLMVAADGPCGGRLVLCHEGGYNAPTVPFFGLAVMEELSGIRTGVVDPFFELMNGLGYQALQPHQDAVIRKAEELVHKLESKVRHV